MGVTRHMNANETSIAAVLAPHGDALKCSDTDTVMKLYSPNGVFLPQYCPSSVCDDAVCKNGTPPPLEGDQWTATRGQTFSDGNGPDWKKSRCATQESHR